ncbi:MAG TPA: peptidylprolyl isomerase [bacterium]|nr:peptidylprolyl isomerase [bacterium]
MKKILSFNMMCLWLLFLLPTLSTVISAEELAERIVAKVDYSIITLTDLMEASAPSVQQIRENFPAEEWDNRIRELRSNVLMQMINEYVCVRFARDNEIVVTDEEIEATIQAIRERAGMTSDTEFKKQLAMEGLTLEELRENLKRQATVRKVMRREVQSRVRVTESDIREYWKENADQYQSKARVRVAVLMMDTESSGPMGRQVAKDRIYEIHEKLESGADFAEMVKEHSDGPATDQGGDIGFLEEGKALPVIEKAAFSLDVGHFSAPLETSFGWVIVKVLERQDAGLTALDSVRDEIENILKAQRARDLEAEWFERERAKTFIQIFEY